MEFSCFLQNLEVYIKKIKNFNVYYKIKEGRIKNEISPNFFIKTD